MSYDNLRAEADNFSNFAGGNNYFDENAYFTPQSNFAGGAGNAIKSYERTLVLTVQNTDTANDIDAVLFGGFAQVAQTTGIVITAKGGQSHAELRRISESSPFLIKGWKLKTTDTSGLQWAEEITVQTKGLTGTINSAPYYPSNYESPTNYDDNIIDDPQFACIVDGNTSFTVSVLANTTLTFIMTIKSKVEVANPLMQKPSIETATAPRPTGNPIADTQMQILSLRERAMGR